MHTFLIPFTTLQVVTALLRIIVFICDHQLKFYKNSSKILSTIHDIYPLPLVQFSTWAIAFTSHQIDAHCHSISGNYQGYELFATERYGGIIIIVITSQFKWLWSWWRDQMNIFRVNGLLWRESVGFPLAKASDAEPRSFLWSAPEQTVEQIIETPWGSLWRHCNMWSVPNDLHIALVPIPTLSSQWCGATRSNLLRRCPE